MGKTRYAGFPHDHGDDKSGALDTKAVSGSIAKGTPTDGQVPVYVAANDDVEWTSLTDVDHGIPVGGTTGQVLEKNSNADFDASWVTPAADVDPHPAVSAHVVTGVAPNAVMNTFGAATGIGPDAGYSCFGIPAYIGLTSGGVFAGGGETLTVRCTVTFSDSSTKTITKTFTATGGETGLTDAEIFGLINVTPLQITHFAVDCESSVNTSTATAGIKIGVMQFA